MSLSDICGRFTQVVPAVPICHFLYVKLQEVWYDSAYGPAHCAFFYFPIVINPARRWSSYSAILLVAIRILVFPRR
ncbi:MAG TPA: hypothetical protein DER02_08525 [Gammaproteobacteria bacterium]|nr:hypothetical protein [Gammaproteobacteria bacterium]